MITLDYFHIPGNVPENGQMENKDYNDDDSLYVTTISLPLRHDNITPFMSRQYHSLYVTTISLPWRHDNITPFTSRQYHPLYVTTISLPLRHNNITPFMSRQYYSIIGHFFSLGAPTCNASLDESAPDYSSSWVLLEVSPAIYSFRMPIVGQNRLLLF